MINYLKKVTVLLIYLIVFMGGAMLVSGVIAELVKAML